MNYYNAPLSLRTSKKTKNKLHIKARKNNMNISQFIINQILQEDKRIKKLKNFNKAYDTIKRITTLLDSIIFDQQNSPYDEFCNDLLLSRYYTLKKLSAGIYTELYTMPEEDGKKTELISVRLDKKDIKRLENIADFYNCKKSSIAPVLLLEKKDIDIIYCISTCFCYITDIMDYFYEKHIDIKDFEREYKLLWKILE